MIFECVNLSLTFSSQRPVEALEAVNFSVDAGEFVCIVGPSGCGKTTLVKLIARLLTPSQGNIHFHQPPDNERLQTAMVFQHQGLFPWMTVLENVAFGLEVRGLSREDRQQRAMAFIARVGLAEFANSYPHQLSGGMRQRAAIMRAFLADPEVLLMDEPFASLDAQTRIIMREELLDTWRENPKTVIYITHDIEEAILLGDRILVMSGRPGTIRADIAVTLPRPRSFSLRQLPAFDAIHQQVWHLIENEVRQSLRVTT